MFRDESSTAKSFLTKYGIGTERLIAVSYGNDKPIDPKRTEEAKKKNALLPAALLHMIIRYGDNILGEFFDKYLEQTLKNYFAYKSRVDEQFKQWLDFGTDFSAMAQKSLTGISPFTTVFKKSRDTEDKEKE